MVPFPYQVGNYVFDYEFYDRKPLVDYLLSVDRGLTWLIGNRRVGKTSVLRRVQQLGVENGRYLPIYIDFTGAITLPDWTDRLWEFIEMGLNRQALSNAQIDLSDCAGFDFWSLQRTLSVRARERGRKLLLLCDEVDCWVNAAQQDPQLMQTLRRKWTASDPTHDPVIIAAGTRRLWQIAEFDKSLTSPLLLHINSCYISQLNNADAEALIEQSQNPNGRVRVSANLRRQIRSLTGGHPYLMQYLCNKLYQADTHSLRETEEFVLEKDVVSLCFKNDYESLSPDERRVLLELTAARTYQEIAAVSKVQDLHSALLTLEKLGFMKVYGGNQYGASSFFLMQWLRTNAPALRNEFETRGCESNNEVLRSLLKQLAQTKIHLLLIDERMGQYVLNTDVPLQLIKEKQGLEGRILDLSTQLHGLGATKDMLTQPPAKRLTPGEIQVIRDHLDNLQGAPGRA